MLESQYDMILKHLKRGDSITPLDALDKYGCFRLAAVICELRKDGYNIESKTVHNSNTRKRYARYTLNSSDNITEQHIDDDVYMVK